MPIAALFLTIAAAQAVQPTPEIEHRHMGRPFISPMGEPFVTAGPGQDTHETWFAQADGNHDGILSPAEMQQDANRFYAILDLNHDGDIDPDEMTNYETVIAPQVHIGVATVRARQQAPSGDEGGDGDEGGRGGHGGGGGGHRGGGGGHRGGGGGGGEGGGGGGGHRGGGDGFSAAGPSGPEGAARFALLNIPEPVAAADTNLNRGVSPEEFRQAALSRFVLLDTNHDGRLTVTELEAMRPSGPSRGGRGRGHSDGGQDGSQAVER